MTTLTIDLEQFTQALTASINRTLPWTWLDPTSYAGSELSPPSYADPVPSVMPSFVLIPNTQYRFDYIGIRYARFCYLLERDYSYEAGELTIIHDLVVDIVIPGDELTPPVVPTSPFVSPTITTGQTVSIGSIGSLGVLFSFIHDPLSSGTMPRFGLAFKITNTLPAVFPKLTMSYITALPTEGI